MKKRKIKDKTSDIHITTLELSKLLSTKKYEVRLSKIVDFYGNIIEYNKYYKRIAPY